MSEGVNEGSQSAAPATTSAQLIHSFIHSFILPLHSTPLHSTPLHSTSLHLTSLTSLHFTSFIHSFAQTKSTAPHQQMKAGSFTQSGMSLVQSRLNLLLFTLNQGNKCKLQNVLKAAQNLWATFPPHNQK